MMQKYLGRTDFNSFTWQGKRSIHLECSRPTLMVGKERMLKLCSIVPVQNTSSIKRNPACNSHLQSARHGLAQGLEANQIPTCQSSARLWTHVWSAAPHKAQEAEADFDWSRVAWVALPRLVRNGKHPVPLLTVTELHYSCPACSTSDHKVALF